MSMDGTGNNSDFFPTGSGNQPNQGGDRWSLTSATTASQSVPMAGLQSVSHTDTLASLLDEGSSTSPAMFTSLGDRSTAHPGYPTRPFLTPQQQQGGASLSTGLSTMTSGSSQLSMMPGSSTASDPSDPLFGLDLSSVLADLPAVNPSASAFPAMTGPLPPFSMISPSFSMAMPTMTTTVASSLPLLSTRPASGFPVASSSALVPFNRHLPAAQMGRRGYSHPGAPFQQSLMGRPSSTTGRTQRGNLEQYLAGLNHQLRVQKNRVEQLNTQCGLLQSQLDQANMDLSQAQLNYQSLYSENAQLQGQNAEYFRCYNEAHQENSELKRITDAEKQDLQHQIDETKRNLNSAKAQIDSKTHFIEEQDTELETLRTKIKEKETSLSQLRMSQKELQDKYMKLQAGQLAKLLEVRKEVTEKENELAKATADNEVLKQQVEDTRSELNTEIDRLKKAVSEAEEKHVSIVSESEKFRKEMSQKTDDLQREIQQLQSTVAEVESDRDSARAEAEEVLRQKQELNAEFERKFESQKSALDQKTGEYDQVAQETSLRYQGQISELQSKVGELRGQLEDSELKLLEANNHLRGLNDLAQKALEDTKNISEQWEQKVEDLASRLSAAERHFEQLQRQYNKQGEDHSSEIRRLESQNSASHESLSSKVSELEESLRLEHEEKTRILEKNTQLEQQASDQSADLKSLQEQLDNAKKQTELANEAMRQEMTGHQQLVSNLQSQLEQEEDLRGLLEAAESKLVKQKASYEAELEKQLKERLEEEEKQKEALSDAVRQSIAVSADLDLQKDKMQTLYKENAKLREKLSRVPLPVKKAVKRPPPSIESVESPVSKKPALQKATAAVSTTSFEQKSKAVPAVKKKQIKFAQVQHPEASVSSAEVRPPATSLVEVPRSLKDVFANAKKLGIPQYFVSLGYPVKKRRDGSPVEITRMEDLGDPAGFLPTEEARVLAEIKKKYRARSGKLPTELQSQGVDKVWAQAAYLESFLDVESLKHWIVKPHSEVCQKLQALQQVSGPTGSTQAKHTPFNSAERTGIYDWRAEQNQCEKSQHFREKFWPLQWLETLAEAIRENPEDKLSQLAGCWADFSIHYAIASRSGALQKEYARNQEPFNWRKLGQPEAMEDSSAPGPSGLSGSSLLSSSDVTSDTSSEDSERSRKRKSSSLKEKVVKKKKS
ncbi:hypothetical protein [Endozoicomonas arenosclerae]|uniref:hypothetical protein n=1 Tax=Endozoicomonas arenosclerae TaxID=1633495 RepID=UPI0007817AFB|nr:hypothetical protein [Endozoicomonas arenosclerae]